MLTITPQASEAIRGVLAGENVPSDSVFRITSQPESGLVVSVTDSPEPDDQIVEGDEVEVCVEPTAAQMLDDKELDATVAGGQVSFSIGQQSA
ncbi:MAG: Fe-S cluster assembly protein HesB [Solirubrobacterales bacterium]